jgi:hypothetical protein
MAPRSSESSGGGNSLPTEAISILADFLKQREGGEGPTLEDLCRQHPQYERELQLLWIMWVHFNHIAPTLRDDGIQEFLKLLAGKIESLDVDTDVAVPPDDSHQRTSTGGVQSLIAKLLARVQIGKHYIPIEELGHGGMGTVYLVWDSELRRHVAQKVMRYKKMDIANTPHPEVDKDLRRFLEEIQIAAQLQHPGIVPV